jgi:16S rRNA (guanine(966)-N(2))-methyltransferase RsmD
MLDRVREALFSTLGERVVGASVLDLCAGTGSLGMEALSRGAERAHMVERDARVLGVLETNLEQLGLSEAASVRRSDALAPSSWRPSGLEEAWADLVFFDPPYPWLRGARRPRVVAAVEALCRGELAPGGLLVLHAPAGELDASELSTAGVGRERTYGRSSLWLLGAREESA